MFFFLLDFARYNHIERLVLFSLVIIACLILFFSSPSCSMRSALNFSNALEMKLIFIYHTIYLFMRMEYFCAILQCDFITFSFLYIFLFFLFQYIGPCGGKTTGQSRMCTFFENLGWKVSIEPFEFQLFFSFLSAIYFISSAIDEWFFCSFQKKKNRLKWFQEII